MQFPKQKETKTHAWYIHLSPLEAPPLSRANCRGAFKVESSPPSEDCFSRWEHHPGRAKHSGSLHHPQRCCSYPTGPGQWSTCSPGHPGAWRTDQHNRPRRSDSVSDERRCEGRYDPAVDRLCRLSRVSSNRTYTGHQSRGHSHQSLATHVQEAPVAFSEGGPRAGSRPLDCSGGKVRPAAD